MAPTSLLDLIDSLPKGVVANDQGYLLAPAEHAVDILSLDPLHAETTVQVPAGANQLVSRDQLVFVNATNAPNAAVIDRSGHLTPILKYQPPTKAKGEAPAPASTATARTQLTDGT